jgi:hypothetical protein
VEEGDHRRDEDTRTQTSQEGRLREPLGQYGHREDQYADQDDEKFQGDMEKDVVESGNEIQNKTKKKSDGKE